MRSIVAAGRQGSQTTAAAPRVDDPGLHDALAALDSKYRLPLTLHYMEGYSLEEIAFLLRIPMGTVKSRMHVGRTRLKSQLEEES